jgi:hypothetical protein
LDIFTQTFLVPVDFQAALVSGEWEQGQIPVSGGMGPVVLILLRHGFYLRHYH